MQITLNLIELQVRRTTSTPYMHACLRYWLLQEFRNKLYVGLEAERNLCGHGTHVLPQQGNLTSVIFAAKQHPEDTTRGQAPPAISEPVHCPIRHARQQSHLAAQAPRLAQ